MLTTRILKLAGLLALILAVALPAAPQQPNLEADAKALLAEMTTKQFEKAAARFDETMARVLPAPKLEESWNSLIAQAGPYQEFVGSRLTEQSGFRIVILTLRFERAMIEMRVAFDANGRIAGLNSAPAQSSQPSTWRPAPYVSAEKFDDRAVTIGSGKWALPGHLAVPKGAGPFPAAVLVHGSGPNDEDESIGPNKPFKDLAWGLASRGIVVLRYIKRTRHLPAEMSSIQNLTVKEEVVDDAVTAVEFLATLPEVDAHHIFVIGHSLGGMLAPRIAVASPRVSGIVALAGGGRLFKDVLPAQIEYVSNVDGTVTEAEQKQIDAMRRAVADIYDPNLKPDQTVDLLGAKIPGSYFLDLRNYFPAEAAATLKIPILALQGERDYQVRMTDFDLWKKSLAGKPNATLKSYPALNHLFIAGPSRPAEYGQPGNVAAEVVDDIALWILRQTKPALASPGARP